MSCGRVGSGDLRHTELHDPFTNRLGVIESPSMLRTGKREEETTLTHAC